MAAVRATLTLMALTFFSCVALTQDENGLRALLIEYRCPLVDRLERLYEAGDPASDQDRFIAVTVPEHLHGYVQCMFHDKRTKVLCEASSGFYFDPPACDALSIWQRMRWLRWDDLGSRPMARRATSG
jgi:hypothetical protein